MDGSHTGTSRIGTGEQARSASKVINAPAHEIFAILTAPDRHHEFDGSGTVQRVLGSGNKLTLGSTFGMRMQLGPLPYVMRNTVVEFEPDRLIGWRHYGRHRWRYELEPIDDRTTKVTETFDWSTAPAPMRAAIKVVGYPDRNQRSIEATLERLASVAEETDNE